MELIDSYSEINFLNPKELNLVLNKIKNIKHKIIVLLMADCGLRVSEVVDLRLSDFDFKKQLLFVRSLKKRDEKSIRKIPLSDRLYRHIADYLYQVKLVRPDDYLFPNRDNSGHIERFAVNRFLKRFQYKHNFSDKLHPHALRHTFATSLVANNVPLENIKVMLGHKKYDTRLIYAHIPDQVLRQNIETITTKQQGLWHRLLNRYWKQPPRIINIKSDVKVMVGRSKEINLLNDFIAKDINVCIKGKTGVGKNSLLDSIQTNKKILILDDTSNIKKSLIYMLLYLLENDKEAIKKLLFSDFDMSEITVKLNKESIPNLCDEIKKIVVKKEYILKINELDSLTPRTVKVLTALKEHFVIITTAAEIPINKGDFLWNFEIIDLKNLNRTESFELIQRLSYDLEIEDFEMFRNHIFEQTDGNPRAVFEMIERYRKEPFILRDTIRNVTHNGALREYDMSYVVILMIASVAILRYLTSELDNPSLRFIGGVAMIMLIISRSLFSRTKRRFI